MENKLTEALTHLRKARYLFSPSPGIKMSNIDHKALLILSDAMIELEELQYPDDDLGELDATKACNTQEGECESCQ